MGEKMVLNSFYRGCALRIAVGIITLTILLLAGSTSAAIWTVDDSGSANYTKVQDAIDNAIAGDTILVYSGIYYENVNVNKPLILRGIDNGGGNPLVNAGGSGSAATLSADGITLERFKLINSGISTGDAGINVISNNNTVNDNNASNNGMYGILLAYSNNIIKSNTMSSNDIGIRLIWCCTNNNTIENNTINSNRDYGIYFDGMYPPYSLANNTLIGNIISNNTLGISFFYASGYNITGNKISNNPGGINFYKSSGNTIQGNIIKNQGIGISLYESDHNTILENNIANVGNGISIGWSTGNAIVDNNASNNGGGIGLSYSTYNTITGNNLVQNKGYGLYLHYSSNNTIYNNYFNNTNNTFDDGNNIWNTTKTIGTNIIGGSYFGGNYWSDYTGKDTDEDGIGDTLLPYNNFGDITNSGDYLPLIPVSKVGGTIRGTTYNDTNSNKIRDTGEEGLANWIIQLRGFDKLTRTSINRTAVTDANGDYSFTGLNSGTYVVIERPQPKWAPTTSPGRSINLSEDKSAVVDFGNRRV